MNKRYTVRVDETFAKRIDKIANGLHISKNEVFKVAIMVLLSDGAMNQKIKNDLQKVANKGVSK